MTLHDNVKIIDTELGQIPALVKPKFMKGKMMYDGKLLYDDVNINICTPTLESCLEGLKSGFELQAHYWLVEQLGTIKFNG